MKRFFVLLLCCVACLGAMSQIQTTKVVKGIVLDKQGNPLPDAVIEATGGAETTYVGADGTFSLEVPMWLKSLTARCAGMNDVRKKITDNEQLVFKMRKSERDMFVNVVASGLILNDRCSHSFRSEDERVGLMIGSLGDWGWYVKVLLDAYDVDFDDFTVAVGFTKGLTKNLYLYSGFGIAALDDFSLSDNAYSCYEHGEFHCHNHSQSGFLADCGLMKNVFGCMNLNLGLSLCTDRTFSSFAVEAVVGVGITF